MQAEGIIATLNYMGSRIMLHPQTLDAVRLHHFHGPRADVNVFLAQVGDGFGDLDGDTPVIIREYRG